MTELNETNPADEYNWPDYALCKGKDPNIFYDYDKTDLAKTICSACIVSRFCLDYAIKKKEDFGVWGGTDEKERRKIIRQRALRKRHSAP